MRTINKTTSILLSMPIILLISCTNETKTAEKIKNDAALTAMKNKEIAAILAKDSMEHIFRTTLNEIDNNLVKIRERERILAVHSKNNGERVISRKEEILQNISSINELLAENKKKISTLHSQVSSYRGTEKRWKKETEEMSEYIKTKESDIISLKAQLAEQFYTIEDLNKKVEDLKVVNEKTNANSQMLDKEIHKAYYTLGTYSELKKHHVVEKEGGVLGIGSTETLKPDFEKAGFTEIDTRQATGIVINGKKAKLVTHHPIDSYELKKEDAETAYLTIKNPDRFWSASKYLVVEVK